ncbi:MAG: IclR family transcriptional regulator [Nitrososphaerales archaeon]
MRNRNEAVGVLAKTFEILSCFRSKPQGLTLAEIAELAGLNKSTAHRLLSQMTTRGFIDRTEDGAYVIGHALFQLGLLSPRPQEFRSTAHPVMTDLARETGETVNLAILDGFEILVIDVIESLHEFRMAAKVGGRKPFYTTALGKVMTAFSSNTELEILLGHIRQPLECPTPHSISTLARLREELNLTRARGYALDDEECVIGVRAVAAPIFSSDAHVEGAISISGPASRVSKDRIPLLASSVVSAANIITARLGGNRHSIRLATPQAGESDPSGSSPLLLSELISPQNPGAD